MHLRLQPTPGNINAQINILQHRLNRYAKIIGFNCIGAYHLGCCWTLALPNIGLSLDSTQLDSIETPRGCARL